MEMEPSGPIRSDIDESESDMGSSPRDEMAEVIVEVRWLAHALGQAFDDGRESVKPAEAGRHRLQTPTMFERFAGVALVPVLD
jgi:hypothetical protein